MDLRILARYPFLREAAERVKSENIALEDLLAGRAYDRARLLGYDRVLSALERFEIADRPAGSEERRVGKECSSPCRSRWSPYH